MVCSFIVDLVKCSVYPTCLISAVRQHFSLMTSPCPRFQWNSSSLPQTHFSLLLSSSELYCNIQLHGYFPWQFSWKDIFLIWHICGERSLKSHIFVASSTTTLKLLIRNVCNLNIELDWAHNWFLTKTIEMFSVKYLLFQLTCLRIVVAMYSFYYSNIFPRNEIRDSV